MIDFTEGSRMRTNASGSPKTQKPNIIPKGQMTNQTPCNYRTPYKPEVQYYDEQMVIVNGVSYTRKEPTPIVIQEDENTIVVGGVKYQRMEDPKPQTLERIITECMIGYNNTVIVELMERILDRVEVEWMPDKVVMDKEEPIVDVVEYHRGWDNCIKYLKDNLK
jgi:hypothetical protein